MIDPANPTFCAASRCDRPVEPAQKYCSICSRVLFRQGEVVVIMDLDHLNEFGAVICASSMKEDDVHGYDERALVLVYPPFKKDIHDSGLRDILVDLLDKQYKNEEITMEVKTL